MFVHEISHLDGTIFSYIQICEILETSPDRMLEYNFVSAAVYKFKAKFNCTDIDMDLNDIPLFRGTKCTTVSSFRKELVNKGAAVPCANGFWQRKFGLKVDKTVWSLAIKATKETRLRVLHWKIMQNIYSTNVLLCKMKVRLESKRSYCHNITSFIDLFSL